MLPAHCNGDRELLVADLDDAVGGGGGARLDPLVSSSNSAVKTIHSLCRLKNAFAVSKLALALEKARTWRPSKKRTQGDAFGDRMAIGAGIAVDGRAGPAGDAGQRLQASQALGRSRNPPGAATLRRRRR